MAYFKIGGNDFSMCVNKLDIAKTANYTQQTNAAGNSVVDYINTKRTITVGIIPLTAEDMRTLQASLADIDVSISFLNPETNEIEEDVMCILPSSAVSYYTIQAGKVLFNAFTLTFTEL